ncbi:MAG: hypothetical protein RI898_1517 [Actinomycetota bacterium]
MVEKVSYDEFGMFHENASEYGIPYPAPPVVSREFISVDGDRKLSALKWGSSEPQIVFLRWSTECSYLGHRCTRTRRVASVHRPSRSRTLRLCRSI